jgi:hypothetical protein
MDFVLKDYPIELLAARGSPCLSLYQPTHRQFPDNRQDPIRFRNLLKQLSDSLQQKYPQQSGEPLLAPFEALAEDRKFWNCTWDGLAVLSAPDFFRVFRLQRPVPELAVVADSFHTKPLLRIVQSADRYQVLALSRSEIKLYEGNRDALDLAELASGVPRTLEEALGEELTESHLTFSSHRGGAGGEIFHGHGSKKDEVDLDAERFFRAIDRAILEHHSRPSGLPLILAALPEHHGLFRRITHNPFLLPEGIDVHPDAIAIDELRERAWRSVEPYYLARLAKLVDEFQEARSKGVGTDDLQQIAEAATQGRVATVLIDADRVVPGRIDQETGHAEFRGLDHPDVDDLLDDLGEMVLGKGGDVVIVPADRMPTQIGAAAIYRF